MILRRFMKHVTDQNWFAVGLDVIVVIVGIFLGLQVTEWNEQRAERAEEAEYLIRLHEDFTQSISVNESNVLLAYNQWEDGKKIVQILTKCQLDVKDQDMFARGIHGAGKFQPIILNRTTIDELNSTGKFQIIQNADLRKAISTHLDDINRVSNIFSMMNDNIVPHTQIIEKYLSYNLSERDPRFPDHEVTWNSIEINFEEACRDVQLKRSITHIYLYVNNVFSLAHPTLEKQRGIIKMLEVEIEKHQ